MPQMGPLFWLPLMLGFVLILVVIIMMVYFNWLSPTWDSIGSKSVKLVTKIKF